MVASLNRYYVVVVRRADCKDIVAIVTPPIAARACRRPRGLAAGGWDLRRPERFAGFFWLGRVIRVPAGTALDEKSV
jgi:hypothetical protein